MHPLTVAIPSALAQLLRGTPLSQDKVIFAWNAAVGPALQRVTDVRLEGSVLFIDVATPQWAREIARSERMILDRLKPLLGERTVTRLEIRNRISS